MSLALQLEPIELKETTVNQLNDQANELKQAVYSSTQEDNVITSINDVTTDTNDGIKEKPNESLVVNDSVQTEQNIPSVNKVIEASKEIPSINKSNPFKSTGSNSDELSLLINALEVQKQKTVKTTKVANTNILDKLSKIIGENEDVSKVITSEQALNTSTSFNESFNNQFIDSNINLKLIDDIGSYLKFLRESAQKYLDDADSTNSVVDGHLSIEGISEIVSDITSSAKNTSSSKTSEITSSVISKLPSFGANGEIIPASNDNSPVSTPSVTPIEEVPFNVSDDSDLSPKTNESNLLTSKDENLNSGNSSISNELDNKNALLSDFEKITNDFISSNNEAVNTSLNENSEFTLEPLQEQLSGAERLRQAQEAALEQIKQNEELDAKLKAESITLNKNSVLEDENQDIEQNDPSVLDEESASFEDDNRVDTILDSNKSPLLDSLTQHQVTDNTSQQAKANEDSQSKVVSTNKITLYYQKGFFESSISPKSYPFNLDMKNIEQAYEQALSQKTKSNSTVTVRQPLKDEISKELSCALENALLGKFGNYQNEAQTIRGVGNRSLNDSISSTLNDNQSTQDLSSNKTDPEFISPATNGTDLTNENQSDLVDETDDSDDVIDTQVVSGSDFNYVEQSNNENSSVLIDGNPKVLRESTLKLLEEDLQFENKRLGRKLEAKDFYPKVAKTDLWFQTILKSGYNDGPVFSALCYSNRIINNGNEYDWTLEISNAFELLVKAPDFHHNLRTRFSFVMNHPIELKLISVSGTPNNSPESLAMYWYLKAIEDARTNIANNKNLAILLKHLGEDIRTMKLSLYTQLALPNQTDK